MLRSSKRFIGRLLLLPFLSKEIDKVPETSLDSCCSYIFWPIKVPDFQEVFWIFSRKLLVQLLVQLPASNCYITPKAFSVPACLMLMRYVYVFLFFYVQPCIAGCPAMIHKNLPRVHSDTDKTASTLSELNWNKSSGHNLSTVMHDPT